jgi:hypothetical protein
MCWKLRIEVISKVKTGEISIKSFKEVQAGMARGEGQKAMLTATKSDMYEI